MANDKKTRTLGSDDIVTTESVGRRGAIGILGASVIGAAAAAVGLVSPRTAKAQSDNDSGPNADPAGGSGQNRHRGATDSDSGRNADQGGRGRTGQTDSDTGPNADRAGHGR